MRIKALILVLFALGLLGACGKKTGLIVYDDSAPEPVLQNVSASVDAQAFHLTLNIQAGSGVVFYQVDRAEVDPSCSCPANWLRYYESSRSTQRNNLKHHFKVLRNDVVYAFRVRAVDSLGRKTAWSKTMYTKAIHTPQESLE